MSDEVVGQLQGGQVPDLDQLVPSGRDDDRLLVGGGEAHAGDPLGVALRLGDGVLALADGVPELDGLIARAGHNLPVIDGEGHGQHVLAVSQETTGGRPGVDVPETEGAVPRAGQAELSVARDDNVLHEVRVATERAAGESVVALLASQVPDDDRLVPTGVCVVCVESWL